VQMFGWSKADAARASRLNRPNKFFAVVKLLRSSALMVAIGAVIYWVGRSRNRSAYSRR
jgi:hypothetical protein